MLLILRSNVCVICSSVVERIYKCFKLFLIQVFQFRVSLAFETVYGAKSEIIEFDDFVRKVEVLNLYNKYSSDEWLYGKWRNFTALRSGQFDWGSVDLSLTVDEQRHLITDVAVATDALDVNLVDTIRKHLVGTSSVIAPVAPSDVDKTIANDIISLVYE